MGLSIQAGRAGFRRLSVDPGLEVRIGLSACTEIGMTLWFVPQIWLHSP